MPDFSMSDLYSLFGQGGETKPNRLQKMDPPAPEPYNYYGYGDPPEPPPPGAPQPYGPPDPMNEAIPPHLRQFYGEEGNYGQPPEAPPEQPGMMQRGWDATKGAVGGAVDATKDAAGSAAGAVGDATRGTMDALGNLGLDHPPEVLQGALQAAEDAFKKALEASKDMGNSALEGAQEVGGAVKQGWDDAGKAVTDDIHHKAYNEARRRAGLPPIAKRKRDDPYYGYQYPKLEHPRPGQDFRYPADPRLDQNGRGVRPTDPELGPANPRLWNGPPGYNQDERRRRDVET